MVSKKLTDANVHVYLLDWKFSQNLVLIQEEICSTEQSTVFSTRKDITKETFGHIDLLAEGDSRGSDCWFRGL